MMATPCAALEHGHAFLAKHSGLEDIWFKTAMLIENHIK